MAQNEVILKLKVQDDGSFKLTAKEATKASVAVDKMSASTERATKTKNKFHKQEKGVAGATSNTTKGFSKQAQTIGGSSGLVAAYATLAANIFALTAAFGALKRAAAFEQLQQGIEYTGAVAGRNLPMISENLREITDYAISTKEAMTSVALGTSAGFSTKQLEGLTKVAKGASLALGRDMTDAMSRLVRGAAKIEPEILDELGIMVRLDEVTRDYAITVGKTANQLTQFERRMAFTNAIVEQGEQKFGAIADNVDANPYDKLSASFTDLAQTGLSMVNTVLTPVVTLLSESPGALIGVLTMFANTIIRRVVPSIQTLASESAEAAAEATRKIADTMNTEFNAIKKGFADTTIIDGMSKSAKNLIPTVQKGDAQATEKYLKALDRSYKARQIKIDKYNQAKDAGVLKDHTARRGALKDIDLAMERQRALDAEIQRVRTLQADYAKLNSTKSAGPPGGKLGLAVGRESQSATMAAGFAAIGQANPLKAFKEAAVHSKKLFGSLKLTSGALNTVRLGFSAAGGAAKLFGAALLNAIPIVGQIIAGASFLWSVLAPLLEESALQQRTDEIVESFEEFSEVSMTLAKNLSRAKTEAEKFMLTLDASVGVIDQVNGSLQKIANFEVDEARKQLTELAGEAERLRSIALDGDKATGFWSYLIPDAILSWNAKEKVKEIQDDARATRQSLYSMEVSAEQGVAAITAAVENLRLNPSLANSPVLQKAIEQYEELKERVKSGIGVDEFQQELIKIENAPKTLNEALKAVPALNKEIQKSFNSLAEKTKTPLEDLKNATNAMAESFNVAFDGGVESANAFLEQMRDTNPVLLEKVIKLGREAAGVLGDLTLEDAGLSEADVAGSGWAELNKKIQKADDALTNVKNRVKVVKDEQKELKDGIKDLPSIAERYNKLKSKEVQLEIDALVWKREIAGLNERQLSSLTEQITALQNRQKYLDLEAENRLVAARLQLEYNTTKAIQDRVAAQQKATSTELALEEALAYQRQLNAGSTDTLAEETKLRIKKDYVKTQKEELLLNRQVSLEAFDAKAALELNKIKEKIKKSDLDTINAEERAKLVAQERNLEEELRLKRQQLVNASKLEEAQLTNSILSLEQKIAYDAKISNLEATKEIVASEQKLTDLVKEQLSAQAALLQIKSTVSDLSIGEDGISAASELANFEELKEARLALLQQESEIKAKTIEAEYALLEAQTKNKIANEKAKTKDRDDNLIKALEKNLELQQEITEERLAQLDISEKLANSSLELEGLQKQISAIKEYGAQLKEIAEIYTGDYSKIPAIIIDGATQIQATAKARDAAIKGLEDEKKALEDRYSKEKELGVGSTQTVKAISAKNQEIYEAEQRSKLSMASSTAGAIGGTLEALAETQDTTSKKGFELNKAFNLAAAVMNTANAITAALARYDYAGAAFAAATGAVQIATIASTSFGGEASEPTFASTAKTGAGADISTGKGTVLGMPDMYSESAANVVETLESIHADEYRELRGINTSMRMLVDNNSSEFFAGLLKDYIILDSKGKIKGFKNNQSLGTASTSRTYTGGGEEWVRTWTVHLDRYINSTKLAFAPIKAGDIFEGGVADIGSEISGSIRTFFLRGTFSALGDVSDRVELAFTKVLSNITDTLVDLSDIFGKDIQKVLDYTFDIGNVELKGLTSEEANEKILGIINSAGDVAAEKLFENIVDRYQRFEEGALETVSRVGAGMVVFNNFLDDIGNESDIPANKLVYLSQSLVEFAGGLDVFSDGLSSLFETFYTEIEQQEARTRRLSGIFEDLNMALPTSYKEVSEFISSIDFSSLADASSSLEGYSVKMQELRETHTASISELEQLKAKQQEIASMPRYEQEAYQDYNQTGDRSDYTRYRTVDNSATIERAKEEIAKLNALIAEQNISYAQSTDAIKSQIEALAGESADADTLLALIENVDVLDEYLGYLKEVAEQEFDLENQKLILTGQSISALTREREKELELLDPTIRGLQEEVWALELAEQKRGMEITLMKLTGQNLDALEMERERELSTLDETLHTLQQNIWAAELANTKRDMELELMKLTGQNLEALEIERLAELNAMDESLRGIQEQIWAAELANTKRDMELELMKLTGQSLEATAMEREAELAIMDESLRTIQEQIWAAELANTKRDLELELMKASGQSLEAVAMEREAELAAMDESLRAIQEQIWAAELRNKTIDAEVDLLKAAGFATQALEVERRRELETMEDSLKVIAQATWDLQDAESALRAAFEKRASEYEAEMNLLIESLSTTVQEVSDNVRMLEGAIKSLENATKGQDEITKALIAKTIKQVGELGVQVISGNYAGLDNLAEYIRVLTGTDSVVYKSRFEERKTRQMSLNALENLKDVLGPQLTVEEQLLESNEEQVDLYKKMMKDQLQAWDDQLNTLLGIDNSVMSVEEAINNWTREFDFAMNLLSDGAIAEDYGIQAGPIEQGQLADPGSIIEEPVTTDSTSNLTVSSNTENQLLEEKIDALQKQLSDSQYSIAKNTGDLVKLMERWDGDGMPAPRDWEQPIQVEVV